MGITVSTRSRRPTGEALLKTTRPPPLLHDADRETPKLFRDVIGFASTVFNENMHFTHIIKDEDAWRLKMLMPGVKTKDDVIVGVKGGKLVVMGKEGLRAALLEENDDDDKDDGSKITKKKKRRACFSKHVLPSDRYKLDEIKAEVMEDGVLVVMVPKVEKREKKVTFVDVE